MWSPALTDAYATQLLNLRLRDHFGREVKKIVRDRGTKRLYIPGMSEATPTKAS